MNILQGIDKLDTKNYSTAIRLARTPLVMTKRAIDIVIGTLLCVIALPIIAVGALVVMVTLRTTSPFFTQTRIGRGGTGIRFPKLRTMPKSMPAYTLKTAAAFGELSAVSQFLRNTHIDELPQLVLVIKGDLSLVGPRPKMPDAVEPVARHYGRMRVRVPQGCTGLWQISRHKTELPDSHPEYDQFYVANQSTALDLWILWRTLAHGLRITRLITLDDVPAWVRARHGAPVLRLLDLTEHERGGEFAPARTNSAS
ncbi:MAG TPA: sugar transferase [Acidimicrobiales bacterium]|nr:sugar transferase [Acidimicrobiales bacterium]